jgi:hypothetical protein
MQCFKFRQIQAGDTCFKLSRSLGVDIEALNPDINCLNLRIGDSLCQASIMPEAFDTSVESSAPSSTAVASTDVDATETTESTEPESIEPVESTDPAPGIIVDTIPPAPSPITPALSASSTDPLNQTALFFSLVLILIGLFTTLMFLLIKQSRDRSRMHQEETVDVEKAEPESYRFSFQTSENSSPVTPSPVTPVGPSPTRSVPISPLPSTPLPVRSLPTTPLYVKAMPTAVPLGTTLSPIRTLSTKQWPIARQHYER